MNSKKTQKVIKTNFTVISKAIYDYFNKVGINNTNYDHCLQLAKIIKPTTKFNKYHYYWYKKYYKENIMPKN